MEFVNIASATPQEIWPIVTFIVALVAILVAMAGFGLYQAAEHHIKKRSDEIAKRAEERASEIVRQGVDDLDERAGFHIAKLYGYHHFAFADIVKSFKSINVEATETLRGTMINYGKQARTVADSLDKERHNELICMIYNNLAWDLADRAEPTDRRDAHYLAEYIMKRINKYPEAEADFRETYAYVLWKLPLRTEDKIKAQDIITDLLKRTDIDDDIKEEWRIRYRLKPKRRK